MSDDQSHVYVLTDLLLELGSESGTMLVNAIEKRVGANAKNTPKFTQPAPRLLDVTFTSVIRDVLRPHFTSETIDWNAPDPQCVIPKKHLTAFHDLVGRLDVNDCKLLASTMFARNHECAKWMRIVATRLCPLLPRTGFIRFTSTSSVRPNTSTSIVQTMLEVIKIRRIMIPHTVAPNFLVERIIINGVDQLHSTDPVPAEMFLLDLNHADPRRWQRLMMDMCLAGSPIELVVRCIADVPCVFRSSMITTYGNMEPPNPVRGQSTFTPHRMTIDEDVQANFDVDVRIGEVHH